MPDNGRREPLLIVPYGIETVVDVHRADEVELLIVPYGIETNAKYMGVSPPDLLIVPYGIETTEVNDTSSFS